MGRTIIATKPKKPPAKSAKPAIVKSASKPAAKTATAKAVPKKAANSETHKLHDIVMKALDQDKGENIVSINLEGKSAIADYMVIVTGTSTRAVVGMAERLRERLGKEGVKARLEGQDTGDWVIVDAGDVIVHVFRAEVREFYNLEKLWSADFSTVDYTLYQSS